MKPKSLILKITLLTLALCAKDNILVAQIMIPSLSPSATVTQRVGITDIKIEYSRPSKRGRIIFGEVVPYGKPWRTGANSPTKFTCSDTVQVAGIKLAPATYAIYTIPTEKEWTILFSPKHWVYANAHKDGDEAAKFVVSTITLTEPVETFTIDFVNLTKTSAELMLSWENTAVKFSLTTDPDRKIMSEIKSKMDNVDHFWTAANYYFDNNKDVKQALEWAQKVVEKNARYWTWHLVAKIKKNTGDCVGAIEAAKKSLELAQKENNEEYIKFNRDIIDNCPTAPQDTKKKK